MLDAVHLVADEDWKLLPQYRFDPASGLWEHERGAARFTAAVAGEDVLERQLYEARRILAAASPAPAPDPPVTEAFEAARWFPLPSEAGAAGALPSLPRR